MPVILGGLFWNPAQKPAVPPWYFVDFAAQLSQAAKPLSRAVRGGIEAQPDCHVFVSWFVIVGNRRSQSVQVAGGYLRFDPRVRVEQVAAYRWLHAPHRTYCLRSSRATPSADGRASLRRETTSSASGAASEPLVTRNTSARSNPLRRNKHADANRRTAATNAVGSIGVGSPSSYHSISSPSSCTEPGKTVCPPVERNSTNMVVFDFGIAELERARDGRPEKQMRLRLAGSAEATLGLG